MINDDEKYYYFAAKTKLELYSSEWLRSKNESITNEDNCCRNALNDSLDYQRIKKSHRKYQNLSHTLISITGKTEHLHHTKKTGKCLNKIIRKLP